MKKALVFLTATVLAVTLAMLAEGAEKVQMPGGQQTPFQQLPLEMFFVCPDSIILRTTFVPTPASGWEAYGIQPKDLFTYLNTTKPMSIGADGLMSCHYGTTFGQYLPGQFGANAWGINNTIYRHPPPDYKCQIDNTKPRTFVCKKRTPKPKKPPKHPGQ